MRGASLDRLLALLIAGAVASGAITLRAGTPDARWVFTVHALVAATLLTAVAMKLRRSGAPAFARRQWRRLALGLGVTAVVAAAIGGGYAWVLSGGRPSIAGFTVMTLHAWAGIALVPVIVLHLVPRRWRLLRPGPRAVPAALERTVSRRGLLLALGFGAVAVGLTRAVDLVDEGGADPRRFTGSRMLPGGGIPPSTTFLLDAPPVVDRTAWRLGVHGAVERPMALSLADLGAIDTSERRAVLDCTSGWAVETTWRGASLATLLDLVRPMERASVVVIRSATGWSANLPLDEARGCLLATGVASQVLPDANGAPCRLVVPTRRGLDWVKWVTEIDLV